MKDRVDANGDTMNYWITTDTHLGHSVMTEFCGRPPGFEQIIFKKHAAVIQPDAEFYRGSYRGPTWEAFYDRNYKKRKLSRPDMGSIL
jgi:calcineurin-like phosphoesterase family protein